VGRYLFISTISVYSQVTEPHADEDAPVGVLDDPTTESSEGGTYGPLKAACEKAVLDVFGAERTTIVRPGLVVGRFDPTDRFTYWVRRVWRGAEMLAPGGPDVQLQWVDVRDLARFAVHLVEREVAGVFNAVRPPDTVTMGDLLLAAEEAAAGSRSGGRDGASNLTWVDWEFLAARDVRPWADLPAWLPSGSNQLLRLSSQRAVAAGLQTSPLLDTVADVLAWDSERGMPALKTGLSTEREAELLAAWRSSSAPVS
jgi:2'-hydroxyisoflavone reductase